MALKTSAEIFTRMPGGGVLDYNRIFDGADNVSKGRKVRHKELERFMHQYLDAMRNREKIEDRIVYIENLPHDGKRFMRDTSARIEERLEIEKELPKLRHIYRLSEIEIHEARANVSRMICLLADEELELIMVAHYICGADWGRISAVLGHQDRWARDRHKTAMDDISEINDMLKSANAEDKNKGVSMPGMFDVFVPEDISNDEEDDIEVERLEIKWQYMEFDWEIAERDRRPVNDDLGMFFGI